MSRRTSIVKALIQTINDKLDGTAPYNYNLYGLAQPKLKFWDEVQEFPSIYASPGTEVREYLPSDFTWGFLYISLKIYVKSVEFASEQLEELLDVIEKVIDDNRVLVYDTTKNYETSEILIQSITTDEGLLAPYGVGEMNLQVRYPLM